MNDSVFSCPSLRNSFSSRLSHGACPHGKRFTKAIRRMGRIQNFGALSSRQRCSDGSLLRKPVLNSLSTPLRRGMMRMSRRMWRRAASKFIFRRSSCGRSRWKKCWTRLCLRISRIICILRKTMRMRRSTTLPPQRFTRHTRSTRLQRVMQTRRRIFMLADCRVYARSMKSIPGRCRIRHCRRMSLSGQR